MQVKAVTRIHTAQRKLCFHSSTLLLIVALIMKTSKERKRLGIKQGIGEDAGQWSGRAPGGLGVLGRLQEGSR